MISRSDLGANPSVVWRWTSCTPSAPAQARTALRCALAQLGYDGEVISNAVLAVSELVANATEHAVGPYELRLRRTDAEVICEVEDRDPRIPAIPVFPAEALFSPAEQDRGGGLGAAGRVAVRAGARPAHRPRTDQGRMGFPKPEGENRLAGPAGRSLLTGSDACSTRVLPRSRPRAGTVHQACAALLEAGSCRSNDRQVWLPLRSQGGIKAAHRQITARNSPFLLRLKGVSWGNSSHI